MLRATQSANKITTTAISTTSPLMVESQVSFLVNLGPINQRSVIIVRRSCLIGKHYSSTKRMHMAGKVTKIGRIGAKLSA